VGTHLNGARLEGRTVSASDGEKLGRIVSVLVDDSGTAQYAGAEDTEVVRSEEELHVRREERPVGSASLRAEVVERDVHEVVDRAPTPERRAGERASSGEDLSRGPTSETRHPDAHDAVRDTTQGPTPEIRRTIRADEAGRTAAAAPAMDRRTRADVPAGQDRRDDRPDIDRTVVEPDAPRVVVEPPDEPQTTRRTT
jgi:hypothetical protein